MGIFSYYGGHQLQLPNNVNVNKCNNRACLEDGTFTAPFNFQQSLEYLGNRTIF